MPLPSSGTISMSDINTEFGRGNNLNAYRGTTYYTNSGGPFTFPSGAISFSDFYGTKKDASNSVTEGSSGASTGYIQSQIGSISPAATINGYTIYQWYKVVIKGSTFVSFGVVGNYTGSWWSYGTYRGTTFYRADCGVPAGSYDSGSNVTSWAIAASQQPTFSGSGTYTLIMYP